jgi:hypothetical protein
MAYDQVGASFVHARGSRILTSNEFVVPAPRKAGDQISVCIDISRRRMEAFQRGCSQSASIRPILLSSAAPSCRQRAKKKSSIALCVDANAILRILGSCGNCRIASKPLNRVRIRQSRRLLGTRRLRHNNFQTTFLSTLLLSLILTLRRLLLPVLVSMRLRPLQQASIKTKDSMECPQLHHS